MKKRLKKNPLKLPLDMDALRAIIKPSDNVVMWKKAYEPTSLKDFLPYKSRRGAGYVDLKPTGVWYACGVEWLDWVEAEMPNWQHPYVYFLKINKRNFLKLKNDQQIKDFIEHYTVRGTKYINWGDVAEDYSGIEICPYVYSIDYPVWYSAWDVASGCVWNTNYIEGVEEVKLGD